MSRRRWTPEEKAAILARHLRDREPAHKICSETGLSPSLLSAWTKQLFDQAAALFDRAPGQAERLQGELDSRARLVERLQHEVSALCLEVLRLKKPNGGPLRGVRTEPPVAADIVRVVGTLKIHGLQVEDALAQLDLPRATYFRWAKGLRVEEPCPAAG